MCYEHKFNFDNRRKGNRSRKTIRTKKSKSLSHIVENYLMSITSKEVRDEAISSKVSKFRGVIKLPKDFNY